jgi:3-oxoacyl-[acyl-carrier-protein] synthase II
MALQAAREAITQATWSLEEDDDAIETVVVVGTSKGSIESWLPPPPSPGIHPWDIAQRRFESRTRLPPCALADIASTLATTLSLPHAPRLTISAACASGLIALIRAAQLLQSEQCRRALVVATEASLHPLFLGSFARLGVLAKPHTGCRPFDQHRDGFLMTEAAAAICLEARPPLSRVAGPLAGRDSRPPEILIYRFALGADASHLTAPDPDGAVLRHLLKRTIPHEGVDLIHAHGTATESNDPTELAAIESTLTPESRAPCLYSHKAALGHSLGAAGLISIALNCLAHQRQIIPGNIRTTTPLPTRNLTLSPTPIQRRITSSIALAAGFGGPSAAVSLIST